MILYPNSFFLCFYERSCLIRNFARCFHAIRQWWQQEKTQHGHRHDRWPEHPVLGRTHVRSGPSRPKTPVGHSERREGPRKMRFHHIAQVYYAPHVLPSRGTRSERRFVVSPCSSRFYSLTDFRHYSFLTFLTIIIVFAQSRRMRSPVHPSGHYGRGPPVLHWIGAAPEKQVLRRLPAAHQIPPRQSQKGQRQRYQIFCR